MTDDDLATVVLREQELHDPAARASRERLLELLDPDFVEHGTSGRVWDRASVMAALAEDPQVSGEPVDFSATRLADDVVLLTFRIVGEAGSLRSSVWVRDPGAGWRLRFHQGTALPVPEEN